MLEVRLGGSCRGLPRRIDGDTAGGAAALAVIVRGELDRATAPTFHETLSRLLDAPVTQVDLHTADLTFCDAAGLTVLASAHQRLAGRGGNLRVLDAPPLLRRLLEITDLEALLAHTPDATARPRSTA